MIDFLAEQRRFRERFAKDNPSHPELPLIDGVIADTATRIDSLQLSETTAPQLDLGKEWADQADKLAYLFAEPLGQSKDQYIDGLPQFAPQPEEYRGTLNIPVLVQTPTEKRLTLARILDIVRVDRREIYSYLKSREVKDWEGDPRRFQTPKTAYATWLNDGSVDLERSIEFVRLSMDFNERGGTVFDGIALIMQKPEILTRHFLNLPGSQYGVGRAPSLGRWGGRPELDVRFVGSANPGFGSVVAGRNIITR